MSVVVPILGLAFMVWIISKMTDGIEYDYDANEERDLAAMRGAARRMKNDRQQRREL